MSRLNAEAVAVNRDTTLASGDSLANVGSKTIAIDDAQPSCSYAVSAAQHEMIQLDSRIDKLESLVTSLINVLNKQKSVEVHVFSDEEPAAKKTKTSESQTAEMGLRPFSSHPG